MQATLKEKGLDYTIDEIKEVGAELKSAFEKLKAAMDENGGELTPEMLEDVSGGLSLLAGIGIFFGAVIGAGAIGSVLLAVAFAFSW